MVETKIFIDIGSNNLCSGNCLDYGSRTGCTVSTGEYARDIVETAITLCHDLTAGNRNTGFSEVFRFDILTNRNDECLTRDKEIFFTCRTDTCTPIFDLADHLWCDVDT